MKRIEKGTPGYLDYKKKVEIIRTVIYFLLVAAIFTLGYVQTKTRSNLLTVVAILGCLPAAKALVGVITRFPYASVDQKLVHEVDTKAHWDQYARGTIVGITRGVNKYHIIRATLESIAYQVNDVLNAMKADSGINLAALKVDGGASANNFLMQTQADIINAPVNRPCCVETTAMGAAYLAGLAVGYWSSKEEVRNNWSIDQKFYPSITEETREQKIKGWNKAVKYSYGWAKDE